MLLGGNELHTPSLYIECRLTHLEPTMRISDGQIPPDSMTHPRFYVELEGVLLVGLIESASLDSRVLVDSWVR